MLAAVLLALPLLSPLTPAHEWYPPDCCLNRDCVPLEEGRVRPMVSGYVVDGVFIVPYGQERTSRDGRYHGCFPITGKLRCLFVPPNSM